MGWRYFFFTYIVVCSSFFLSLFPTLHCTEICDPESLDSTIHDYAMQALVHHRTGTSVNVSLPSNFSGIRASVVRIRSATLWDKGANVSSFLIPPRVIPFPFVKRLALVYQHLGDWSSCYYKVPGYSLVAPVVGFTAYNASDSKALGNVTLKFSVKAEPIYLHFPKLVMGKGKETPKCVKFLPGGLVQFSNLTGDNVCITQGDGHFSVAVPNRSKDNKVWKWWVAGFVAGFVGLILLGVIGITIVKLVRSKRVREMEGGSENGVAFDTSWIRGSQMPYAPMIRTQPTLEHRYNQ